MKVLFGKYKNKQLEEIANLDPQYLIWIANNLKFTNKEFKKELFQLCRNISDRSRDEANFPTRYEIDNN